MNVRHFEINKTGRKIVKEKLFIFAAFIVLCPDLNKPSCNYYDMEFLTK